VLRGNILHPVIPLHKAAAVIEHIAAGGKMAALVDPHVPPVGFKVEVGQHIIRHIQHFHFLNVGPAQRLLAVNAGVKVIAIQILREVDQVMDAACVFAAVNDGLKLFNVALVEVRQHMGQMVQLVNAFILAQMVIQAQHITVE